MVKRTFPDQRDFKAWNDAMVQKYDLEEFHRHPSALVRYVEGTSASAASSPSSPPGLVTGCSRWVAKRLEGRAALIQADAERLPFRDRVWDRVYCSEVLEHTPDPDAALAELRRVLVGLEAPRRLRWRIGYRRRRQLV